MSLNGSVETRLRWLRDERGELVEYEIVEPTSGTAWEGLRGRRPRARLKGEIALELGVRTRGGRGPRPGVGRP